MITEDRPFFVVTGGPGGGKTSLLEDLSRRGLTCMSEAGRAIIRQQMAIGGSALPWVDIGAFAEAMLVRDIQTYRDAEATGAGPVVFDRGIPDIVGYLRLTGLPVPSQCETAARSFRYHCKVFAAPPWRAIFAQDEERRQTFDEAEATFQEMMQVYDEYGYEIVPLPLDTIKARARFVLNMISRCI